MKKQFKALFITHRGERHQMDALNAAPAELDITIRRSPSKEEIISLIHDKDFLISERTGVIDADIIKAGENLKLIQRLGSLTYDIDIDAAKNADIPVSYIPVRSCIMVAEHMVMQILSLAKRLPEMMEITNSANDYGKPPKLCDEDYFAYNWANVHDIQSLWGATIGILGFGEIGAELARRLSGYGCTILYNKRSKLPARVEEELTIQFATSTELMQKSDYLCMLLPYFPETNQSLDNAFFLNMKSGACFISCGGSGVVNEQALTDALKSNHLYGAALDTFTMEPISKDNPLLTLSLDPKYNVILTPHMAAGTSKSIKDLSNPRSEDYINVINILNGQKIRGRIA